jgi:hypothetical protein
MTVGELLDLLIDVGKFRLISVQNESDILYEDEAEPAKVMDRYVLDIPVYYFGIADKDTIEFYVDERDF